MSDSGSVQGGRLGAFREPANDDPHGTRAIAMALPAEVRAQLGPSGSAPSPGKLFIAQLPMQLGIQLAFIGTSPILGGALIASSMLLIAYRAPLDGPRLELTARELSFVRGDRRESFPWRKVESFERRFPGARVKIRVGESLVTRYALRNVFDQRRVPAAPPQWIPTEVRELAGGARRSVATVFGSIGVVVFTIAAGIALATHLGTGGWMAMLGSALAYALLAAGIASRSQLTARPDGLHLPRRVIAWDQIDEAAPHGGAGSSEVRIRVADEDAITVYCGDARRAAKEILERRDLARSIAAAPES